MPVPYSTLRLGAGPTDATPETPGNAAKALDIADYDRIHDGLHRLVVEHGHAAHLAVPDLGAHVEFLQVLHARQDEEVRRAGD